MAVSGDADDCVSWRRTPGWLWVFYNNMFFGCTGFSIVLPTMWPYLRAMGAGTGLLAWAVAMYSVGEGAGGWLIGHLLARYPSAPKRFLEAGMFLGFLAAFLYSIAPLFGESVGPFVVLVTRFLSGLDNGGRQTIEQTFIGTKVPAQHQTTISSRLSSFAITGIMLGPAFGAPLQALNWEIPAIGLRVDGNNGPGVVLCFVCAMNLLATSLYFNPTCPVQSGGSGHEEDEHGAQSKLPPPRRAGVLVCYLVFFAVNLSMASLETITPVVCQRLYGWGPCLHPCPFKPQQAYVNLLLTAGGLLSLLMSVLMSCYLGAKVFGHEILAVSIGLCVLTATNLGNVDFPVDLPAWRFASNYLLGALFGGLLRGPTVALLNQIIGPHPKAPYMGVLFAIGALPRVLGPFALIAFLELPPALRQADHPGVYDGPLPRTWLLYGSQGVLFFATLIFVQAARKATQPYVVQGLSLPLLGKESSPTAGSEGAWLPSTPVGMREGIGDFAGLRKLSSRSL